LSGTFNENLFPGKIRTEDKGGEGGRLKLGKEGKRKGEELKEIERKVYAPCPAPTSFVPPVPGKNPSPYL
jgi:hypothetical protein